MLPIDELRFKEEGILNQGVFVLVNLIPALEMDSDKRIGTDVVVALTGHQYEKITVRVAYAVSCSAFDARTIQQVTFTNFLGRFIRPEETSDWQFTATADQFQVVSP